VLLVTNASSGATEPDVGGTIMMNSHDTAVAAWFCEFESSIWNFNLATAKPYTAEEILDMAEKTVSEEENSLPW
jgi:hypothetical protein